LKLKRSRVLNADEQTINADNHQPPLLSITPKNGATPQTLQKPITTNFTDEASSPMDVSQSSSFLSVEPGSQACRAK